METDDQENGTDPTVTGHDAPGAQGSRRGLASRRSLLAGGAGAALAAGAAAVAPTPAAAEVSAAGHHHGYRTRIEVAPVPRAARPRPMSTPHTSTHRLPGAAPND
jgi:hypothetical protein